MHWAWTLLTLPILRDLHGKASWNLVSRLVPYFCRYSSKKEVVGQVSWRWSITHGLGLAGGRDLGPQWQLWHFGWEWSWKHWKSCLWEDISKYWGVYFLSWFILGFDKLVDILESLRFGKVLEWLSPTAESLFELFKAHEHFACFLIKNIMRESSFQSNK